MRPRSRSLPASCQMRWMISWPGLSAGCALPGHDDLHGVVDVGEQPLEARRVAHEQVGALVGREAPREAERERLGVEQGLDAPHLHGRVAMARGLAQRAVADEAHEAVLLREVRGPQDLVAELSGAAGQRGRVGVLVELEHARHLATQPGGHVDAVRDRADLVARPHLAADRAVQRADRVGAAGQPQRERGQVEAGREAVVPAVGVAEREQLVALDAQVGRGALEVGPHGVLVEDLVARRHRRVRREHVVRADLGDGLVERPQHRLRTARAAAADRAPAQRLEREEGRVALVHVVEPRRDAERLEHRHRAAPEHDLLQQAHLASADVELARDVVVLGRVVRRVAVEQQQRHVPDEGRPHAQRDLPVAGLDLDAQRAAVGPLDAQQRQAHRVELGEVVLLPAVLVDDLVEVAAPVEEADAEQRQPHVRRLLEVVGREDAEAARVDRQRLAQAVLGRDVGDGRLVEPRAPQVGVEEREHARHLVEEGLVDRELDQALPAREQQQAHRVCGSASTGRGRCARRSRGPRDARSTRGCRPGR
jgi:hypothetical protein